MPCPVKKIKNALILSLIMSLSGLSTANAEDKDPTGGPQLNAEELRAEISSMCENGPRTNPKWGRRAAATMINQGWKEISAENGEKAGLSFLSALFIGPERPDAYWGLGISSHISNYSLEIIRSCFNSAIKIIPNVANLYSDYGRVMMQRSETEEAISLFEKAFSIDKDNVSAHIGMAQIYQAAGNETEANKHIERVKELTK